MYLDCDSLSIAYHHTLALDHVSFQVNKGDYLCILGANGSGKSTLLQGLLGLIGTKSGKVTYGEGLKATEIGYLPQKNVIQKDFPASVFEIVLSGTLNRMGNRPFYKKTEKEQALDYMTELSIDSLRNRSYSELSGGQQQRVLLARALMATDKLLLLDEPVTGLDPVIAEDFYKIIKKINKDKDIAVIMVTHDMEGALNYSNKILHLDRSVLFFGDTEVYTHSKICKIFLGGDCQC